MNRLWRNSRFRLLGVGLGLFGLVALAGVWLAADLRTELEQRNQARAEAAAEAFQPDTLGLLVAQPEIARAALLEGGKVADREAVPADPEAPSWFRNLVFPEAPTARSSVPDSPYTLELVADPGPAAGRAWRSAGRLSSAVLTAGILVFLLVPSGSRPRAASPLASRQWAQGEPASGDSPDPDRVAHLGDSRIDNEVSWERVGDQLADAVIAYDKRGEIRFANPAAEALLGYEAGGLLGRSISQLVPPWRQGEIAPCAEADGESAAILDQETQRLTKQGRLLDVALSCAPMRDTRGRVVGYGCVWRDVTERKQGQTLLRLLERSISGFQDGILITDCAQDNAVIFANEAVERITGYPVAEIMGRNPRFLSAGWEEQEGLEQLREAIREGRSCRVSLLNQRKQGDTFWNELTVSPVTDSHGRATHFIGMLRDVTQHKQAHETLARAEARLSTVVENAPVAICITNREGTVTAANAAFLRLTGQERGQVEGQPGEKILPEALRGRLSTQDREPSQAVGEVLVQRAPGDERITMVHSADLGGEEGEAQVAFFLLDITDHARTERDLAEEKERAQVTLASIGDGVITATPDGMVDYLNPVAEKILGWSPDDAQGLPVAEVFQVLDEESRQPLQGPMNRALRLGRKVTVSRQGIVTDPLGTEHAVQITAAPIRARKHHIIGGVLVFHDVTQIRSTARQMTYEARHDPLTGLLNRREFQRRLEDALQSVRKGEAEHVLAYLDLDHFKPVNDTAGHAAGDELLRQLTGQIRERLRDSDLFARLGGDEFALLLYGCSLEAGKRIAEQVRSALADYRFVWNDQSFHIGVSIGLVPITADSGPLDDVLQTADAACYSAKQEGRNRIHLYDTEAEEIAGSWVARLQRAVEEDHFTLFQQSAQPLQENKVPQYQEILLRLQEPAGATLAPDDFLPAAEQYGMLREIDEWVVSYLFSRIAQQPAPANRIYGVNISGISAADPAFGDFVQEQAERTGVSPETICFELKESTVLEGYSVVAPFMDRLAEAGFLFALEEFGYGRSSFEHLERLPLHFLKLEGALVKGLREDSSNRILLEALNRLGHQMGLRIIASQVEETAAMGHLRELGLDYAQGFAIAKPGPLDHHLHLVGGA